MPYVKVQSDELYHYGLPRRSGRYKWGSGDRPFQGDNIGGSLIAKRKAAQNSIDERKKKSAEQLADEYSHPMRTSVKGMNDRIKKMSEQSADRVINGPLKEREGKRLINPDAERREESPKPEETPKSKDATPEQYREAIKKMTELNNKNVELGNKWKKELDELRAKQNSPKETEKAVKNLSKDAKEELKKEAAKDPNSRDLYGKNPADMSDKELANYLSRRKMEDRYAEYYKKDHPNKYEQYKTIAKGAKAVQEGASKYMDEYYKQKHKEEKARIDFSGVSDQDLQRAVNRMRLEQNYRDLVPDVISDGERKAKAAMNTIGSVLSVAEPVLNVAEQMSLLFGYRR